MNKLLNQKDNNVLFKLNNLSKHYKMGEVEVKALKEVSLELSQGEFIVVLGASGSGKSTLLNLIGGMDMPTAGEVWYKDKNISNMKDKGLTDYRRNNVGFVFQFYNLMSNLTAMENVELASEITKNPLDIYEVMEGVGLSDRLNHFPAQMSGGEQQRVAIARAIAKNPDILLCDEPTGALDYKTGIEVLKVLKSVHQKYNKTVVIITHNVAIAEMADRVLKLRSGVIQDDYVNENPIEIERIEW